MALPSFTASSDRDFGQRRGSRHAENFSVTLASMRAKQVSLSVAAGLATPGAVFLLNSGFGGFRFGFIEPWFAAMYVAV